MLSISTVRFILDVVSDEPVQPLPLVPVDGSVRGPVGTPRSVGLTILVSIVTLGIWTLPWSYWTGNELKAYRRDGLGGVAYLVITFLISPVTMFLLAN